MIIELTLKWLYMLTKRALECAQNIRDFLDCGDLL